MFNLLLSSFEVINELVLIDYSKHIFGLKDRKNYKICQKKFPYLRIVI
jgi:hypothetical protein